MAWDVEYTDQFGVWWESLDGDQQERVAAAVELLAEIGPGLGRPLVDTLVGARHANLKELRPRGGHLRVLFAFDPRRVAVLLLGGDKSGRWSEWYRQAIPAAESLYDEHLVELRADEEKP
jgi:hypothetical protein